MSSRDLQAVVKTQKAFIHELLDRLEGKEKESSITVPKYDVTYDLRGILLKIHGTSYSVYDVIRLLNDAYFNGLTLEQILDLAKKSIRLTDDNCKMQHKLEDIAECLDDSELGQHIKKIIEREY